MTIFKKIFASIIITCLFFVVNGAFSKASAATRLYFDPSSVTTTANSDFTVNVLIDAGTNSVFGADALINLPSGDVAVKSITNGGFFTDFSNPAGTTEIHGFFSATNQFKTGSGTFAVLTLTPIKGTGNGTVTFSCSGSGNDTEILNSVGQNILNCSSLNQLSLAYTSPANNNNNSNNTNTGNTNTGNTNTDNNTGGSTNGPTNACNGTCGSNYNCNAGLYCFQGYCRNPFCNTSVSCICPVATPTVKPTPTLKPTVKATPLVVVLAKTTPFPTSTPSGLQATPAPQSQTKLNLMPIIVWLGLGLAGVIVLIIIINLFRKKGPPQINPPTSVHAVEPPMPQVPDDSSAQWPTGQNPPSTQV